MTEKKIRFRPCTHLTSRPAAEGDIDVAGRPLSGDHIVIVRIADCHQELDSQGKPMGEPDPAGASALPMTYIGPAEMRGSLVGNRECLYRVANGRVYRASLSGNPATLIKPEPEPDYAAMTLAELVVVYNAKAGKALKKWGKTKSELIDRIVAASA
jgi:hypothetical protein